MWKPRLAHLVPDDVVGRSDAPVTRDHAQEGVHPGPDPFFVFHHQPLLQIYSISITLRAEACIPRSAVP
jgi:hypothetical protein